MAISLSAITDLETYNIGSAGSSAAEILNTVIDSNDLKIEVSLGNSSADDASEYSSKKLDLNLLVKAIKDYIDECINELRNNIQANFVRLNNENRPITTNRLTIRSPNIILEAAEERYPRIELTDEKIQMSQNANRFIQIIDTGTTIKTLSDRDANNKYKGTQFDVATNAIEAKAKAEDTASTFNTTNITSKFVLSDNSSRLETKNDSSTTMNQILNNNGGIVLKTVNKPISITTDGIDSVNTTDRFAYVEDGQRILLRSGKKYKAYIRNDVRHNNEIDCVASAAVWN